MFRDNLIRRSEARKALIKKTDIPIDQEDMEDLLPITSVTPTDKLNDDDPDNDSPKPIKQRDPTDSKPVDNKSRKSKVEIEDE